MSTKVKLYTVVDISSTGARRGEDPMKYKQMQNYLTVMNTLGLRSNPIADKTSVVQTPEDIEFGERIKAKHCWQLNIEYENDIEDIENLLTQDFNLVPFIKGLEEDTKFSNNVFLTSGKDCNIVFTIDDK